MTGSRVLLEHVSMVRQLLEASHDPEVARVGRLSEIVYLVDEHMTPVELQILDALIESISSGDRPVFAKGRLQAQRDALAPYVGKNLLKTGMQCASRHYEIYVELSTETIVALVGFDRPESLPEELADATLADQARWIFDHSSSNTYSEGQRVVELLLAGREAAALSSEELLLVAKGYNWWGKNEKALDTTKLGLARTPDSNEWLSLARLYVRNAGVQDFPQLLSSCDACITEGIGPAPFWHLLKADAFIEIATGERELEEYEWLPGDPLLHPELLRPAAEALHAALSCEPGLRARESAPDWVGDWNLRFAAVLQSPAFGHLSQ